MNECVKCKRVQSLQSCPILCDAMDGSPPGSSIHGILQARILEYISSFSSRGSSQSRVQPHILHCRWVCYQWTSLVAQMIKCLLTMQETPGFSPSVWKILWGRKWQPTLVLFLENPMDGGVWQAIVHGVSKSRTGLSDFTFTFFSFFTTSTTWGACMNEEQLIISKVQLQGGECW